MHEAETRKLIADTLGHFNVPNPDQAAASVFMELTTRALVADARALRWCEWPDCFRAGCEASHAVDCDAVLAERDQLRGRLAETERFGQQRVADLQAEFARHRKVLERQLAQARAAGAVVPDPEAAGGQ